MKVLWVSRHKLLQSQVEFLKDKLGDDVIIEMYSDPVVSADGLDWYVSKGGYEYVAVVLPLSIIARLVELARGKYTVLYPEMESIGLLKTLPVPGRDYDIERDVVIPSWDVDGSRTYRIMRFKSFKRIKAIKLELEDI